MFLTDRTVDLIISGGVNIYPAEIESVLLTHPRVGDAAVIGVPSATDMGEDVLAIVEPIPVEPDSKDSGRASLTSELVDHCRQRLAGYKCPTVVEVVDSLPRTDSGKLLKELLRDERRAQMS